MADARVCWDCKKMKKASEFYCDKRYRDNTGRLCRQCNIRRTRKWQIKTGYSNGLAVKYGNLKKRLKTEVTFSIEEFKDWYGQQIKICHYCLCPESLIMLGKWSSRHGKTQTKKLTIDRIDSSKGYSLDNMCLACDICNMAKSNIFTETEFVEIALKYLKPRWQALNSI